MTREEAIKEIKSWDFLEEKEIEAIHTLIPELKESEDKKIGNVIYCIIRDNKEVKRILEGNGVSVDNALSYLEKQKESTMPSSTELIEMWDAEKEMLKEKDFRDDAWRLAYNAFMDGFARGTCIKFEKQKEQKPLTIESAYEKFVNPETLKEARTNKYIKAQLLWELMHNGIITEVDYQYLTDDKRKPWTAEEYRIAYQKGFDMSEQLKQKEQKPAEIDEYEIIKRHITYDSLSSEVNKRLKECGWYVTEKSAEWNANDKAFIKDCARILNENGYATSAERLLSMFPVESAEWSEEDETRFTNILIMLKEYLIHHYSKDDIDKSVDWLENRVKFLRPQPKQEWSEEDEKTFERFMHKLEVCDLLSNKEATWARLRLKSLRSKKNISYGELPLVSVDYMEGLDTDFEKQVGAVVASAMNWEHQFTSKYVKWTAQRLLECAKDKQNSEKEWSEEDKEQIAQIERIIKEEGYSKTIREKIHNWFDSLRPSWKPTEEQMKWLRDVIETVPMTCRQQIPLESLYNDLKKLM